MADAMQAMEGSGLVCCAVRLCCAVVNLKCRIGWAQACDGIRLFRPCDVRAGREEAGWAREASDASLQRSSWKRQADLEAPVLRINTYTWLLPPSRSTQNVLLGSCSKTHGWLAVARAMAAAS